MKYLKINAGSLEIESKCSICNKPIKKLKYAVRDSQNNESYLAWLYRHVKKALTFRLRKPNPGTFLPVCSSCAKKYNH